MNYPFERLIANKFKGIYGKCAQYWPDYKSRSTRNLHMSQGDVEIKKSFGIYSVRSQGETLVEFGTYRRSLEVIKTEASEFHILNSFKNYI